MKKIAVILIILSSFNGIAQNKDWKKQTSKDGKVEVKSYVEKTDDGKVIYYTAETKTNVSLDKLEAFLKNSENHKLYLERTSESKEIEKLSNNEWITYYFLDAPWPVKNSDVVIKFTLSKNEKGFKLTGIASPDSYEKQKVKRINLYNIEYNFEKISDQESKVTLVANFKPANSVPKFLLKKWFPKGPSGILTRLFINADK